MTLILKRIIRSGWSNFKRQGNLSFATCLILVITLSLISSLFLCRKVLNFLVADMEDKADISVYFQQDCSQEEMFGLQEELDDMPETKETRLISKDEALEDFIERHNEEDDLMESLIEVGANPFFASLSIRAAEMDSYENIVNFLAKDDFSDIIEKVDYSERKSVIERIFALTDFLNNSGLVISILFALVSVLIVFNTIRLEIYSQKNEIAVMRLVGASNGFINGPFIVQGIICGLLSFLVSSFLVGLLSYFLNPAISQSFFGFRFFDFFKTNFWLLLGIQTLSSLALGILPSLLAVRKYLDI